MNKRMIFVLIGFALLLVFFCVGLYLAYTPSYQQDLAIVNAARTQTASDAEATLQSNRSTEVAATKTSVVIAQNNQATVIAATKEAERLTIQLTQTRESQVATQEAESIDATATASSLIAQATADTAATLTAVPTSTPSATPIATPTQPVPWNVCVATLSDTDRYAFEVPGGGRRENQTLLQSGAKVNLIGRLEDTGWFLADHNGKHVWIRSDIIDIEDDCELITYDLSYLLGNIEERDLLLDETFATNLNKWFDASQQRIFPEMTYYGEYHLPINAQELEIAEVGNNPRLLDVTAFELTTSVTRQNATEGYFGIRFRVNNENYYEVRIMGDCEIQIYANDQLIDRKIDVDPGENTCSDNIEDYLVLEFGEDYKLTVWLNDSEPAVFSLEDLDGFYTTGEIQLVADRGVFNFTYITITVPHT